MCVLMHPSFFSSPKFSSRSVAYLRILFRMLNNPRHTEARKKVGF
jgi:hypothetical protein